MGLAGRFEDVGRGGVSRSNSLGRRTEGELRSVVKEGQGVRPRRTGREGRRGSGAHPARDWLMGVAERWPHRRRRGDTCVWAWLGGQGAGLVPAEAQGRGGVFLWIQPAAGQWAGPGRGGEAGGALPPPPDRKSTGAERARECASRTLRGSASRARVRQNRRRRRRHSSSSSSSARGSGPSRGRGRRGRPGPGCPAARPPA